MVKQPDGGMPERSIRVPLERSVPPVERRVGTAGWSLPRDQRDRFEGAGTHLMRYAARLSCVEINSSFYRPHRQATYARWAAAVPDDFRFSVKIPKEITHVRRLSGIEEPLRRFLEESAGLGAKRDVLLVQLPPSFAYDASIVPAFLEKLRREYAGRIACEPRHPSWFEHHAEAVIETFDVTRVAADPAIYGAALAPGGAASFQYWRLHGSPRTYYSPYDPDWLAAFAERLRAQEVPLWCIFDNTAHGAATANALVLREALQS